MVSETTNILTFFDQWINVPYEKTRLQNFEWITKQ